MGRTTDAEMGPKARERRERRRRDAERSWRWGRRKGRRRGKKKKGRRGKRRRGRRDAEQAVVGEKLKEARIPWRKKLLAAGHDQ